MASQAWQREKYKLWRSDSLAGKHDDEMSNDEGSTATDDAKMHIVSTTDEEKETETSYVPTSVADDATVSSSVDTSEDASMATDSKPKTKSKPPKYVYAPDGLFPIPWSKTKTEAEVKTQLYIFDALGQFLARAILDGRLLDMSFNKSFLMWLLNQCSLFDLSHLKLVDEAMWKSLTKL